MKFRRALVALACLSVSGLPAMAAGNLTNGLPVAGGSQYPTTLPLTGNELIPADTQLPSGLNPQSEAVSVSQIAAYIGNTRGTGFRNALIGGDFTTNLWQRGTTVGSITTTATYTADRFFAWSGTSTTMSVAQDTTAAEVPVGYAMSAKVARTGTGVVQTCVAQVVESAGSYQFQGTTPEFDFFATAGAGFSAANSNLQAYIVYGTAVDEGASKLAFGLNGGGGGSSAWTGQTNVAAALFPISTTMTRYVAVGTAIPATAKEVAVALCWTPVGASPTNDYVAIAGLQLTRNANLAYLAGTTVPVTNVQASAFERRPIGIETDLQQRYYNQINEAANATTQYAMCQVWTTTSTHCIIPIGVTMRITPTAAPAFVAGFAVTGAAGTVGSATAIALTTGGSTPNAASVTVTTTAGTPTIVAGNASILISNSGAGVISLSSEL